jgi:kynureninase
VTDPLLVFRSEFPILERATYLVSNSLGAMPRGVADRLAEYVDEWAELGVRAWANRWWEMPVTIGDEIAPLIGAGHGEVAMVPNLTIAQTAVLSSLDYSGQRDTIVMTELDFPSVRYVYDQLATRLGARIVVVPSDDGIGIETERLLAAIDQRTRLVAISQVLFRSAFVIDAAAVCRRAHEVGALVSLDAFHSVGVLPVDVKALGVDFLAGGVLKWLCGGPGGCFLYVAPSVSASVAPGFTGWQAHERPFGFEAEMHYAEHAWRWLNGTPAIPALFAAIEGPRIVRRAGIEAIRAKSVRQTTRLIELADARGYPVTAPRDPERRGGTIALDVPHAYGVAQALLANGVIVDYRPNAGVRLGPHFYTADDELEHAVDLIDDILRDRAWEPHEARRATVT